MAVAPLVGFIVVMSAVTAVLVSPATGSSGYDGNLKLIRDSSVRNTNHDDSPHRDLAQDNLLLGNHFGPRSDYLGNPGGNPEQAFPVSGGGQFRVSCEFSHFAYDDPLVYPGKPGAAHLHVFWGNTDVNAFSTYDTLVNSGGSTCNGGEVNRTGYWAPALFDADGDVRIPMRINVYYKGYGLARGSSQLYPPGAAIIAEPIHSISYGVGGVAGPGTGDWAFHCTDAYRSGPRLPAANVIPVCDDTNIYGNPTVLEHHIKFQNCLLGDDPADPESWSPGVAGSWFYSYCGDGTTFPNIEYILQYQLEPGETTEGWYLSSDVDPTDWSIGPGGSSNHGDWWGGWHPRVNEMWLDNCTNYAGAEPSGCGHGYLSDGGPDGANPLPGPALKFRPQYDGPIKVAAATLFDELCPRRRTAWSAAEMAYCVPVVDHSGTVITNGGERSEQQRKLRGQRRRARLSAEAEQLVE
jgi:hypothetical protein